MLRDTDLRGAYLQRTKGLDSANIIDTDFRWAHFDIATLKDILKNPKLRFAQLVGANLSFERGIPEEGKTVAGVPITEEMITVLYMATRDKITDKINEEVLEQLSEEFMYKLHKRCHPQRRRRAPGRSPALIN